MGGRPLPNFLGTLQMVLRSLRCYHLQDPSEAHKQLKTKTVISINDLESTKKFLRDKKEMTVEELLEIIIDFLEFCGMYTEFYLPDPQDPTEPCFILWEDSEY